MTVPVPTLIELSDVETRLGEVLAATEVAQVRDLIEYASDKLRGLIDDLDLRVLDGSLRMGLVRGTLVTAVCRALDTLRVGLRVRASQFPEITTTYADSDDSLVYFTDKELELLQPSGPGVGGAFSIRLG
ncbi:hypothetical protein GS445_07520 [Rhodococcus hoagii]|uniref:Uncharacterized protein n=1 Tax=Rhodococcus hoagii TaxID=43767 RepID=A0A9Q2ST73_RHOHA|nr:hypothetical protein [Prescottella equi]MBM4480341.1 hypothetical protein [Prescottella equi]MBM4487450.1 hypothetical protein [Prescottella equi]MBM4495402.1 hypothetical protein [Prescottella equi]MBM4497638.1 hypothetical protein [Prescottella equi]MBM4509185.1 hypothetical protein [Prescottella equi]